MQPLACVSVSTSSDFTSGTGTNTLVSGDSFVFSTTSDFSGNKYRLPVVFHNAGQRETNFQKSLFLILPINICRKDVRG
jgi:hypothetical protein